METKYYHKNSKVVAYSKNTKNGYSSESTYDEKGNQLTFKDSDGYSCEYTYDEKGNQLTFKNSNCIFKIKGQYVTKEEFDAFINNQNRPCVGKKVIVDGIEYELK